MKKIFFYLMVLLPSLAFAQAAVTSTEVLPKHFTINGKVGNLNSPARAYLFYQVGANKIVDSALIFNGHFSISGNVLDPNQALLVIDHKGAGAAALNPNSIDALSFFLEKDTITVTSSTDSVAKGQISGSPVTDAYKRLMELMVPVVDGAKQLKADENAATPAQQSSEQYQNAEDAKRNALAAEQTAIFEKFIRDNRNNYLSLIVLHSLGPSPDYLVLNDLFNSLADNLKRTEMGKQLKSSIEALKPTALGTIAPDFTENDVNGAPVSLSSFRGKYVLIDFWASWCGPCRAENPNIVKAFNKFKSRNFTIIGISLDKPDGRDAWLAAIQSDGLHWTQLSDLHYWSNQVALLYAVSSIPHNFLLDPTGKIIAKDLRGSDLDNKLTEIFGKM